MQMKIIKTEKLDKEIIEKHMVPLNLYSEFNNLLFFIKDAQTGVFDLDNNNFLIPFTKGIIHPIFDENKDIYFRIVSPIDNENFEYSWDDWRNQPKFTSESYKYYFNVFNELGKNIYNINKYYFDNHMWNEETIRYFDVRNTHYQTNFQLYNNPVLSNEFLKLKKIYRSNSSKHAKKITNENWDAMSDYKYGLSIIYKDGKYGVVDDKYKIVFDYDDNINYIKIISSKTLMLKNKNDKKALYNLENGYLINFDDNIKFNSVYELYDNVFELINENYSQILINKKICKGKYNYIYNVFDEIIILENKNKTNFLDINGNLLLTINSNVFYKSDSNIYYKENNIIYQFNFKTKIKKAINNNFFSTEDGNNIEPDIDEILNNYKYYYFDEKNNNLILFKEKKYGIEIANENGVSAYRWFKSLKQLNIYQKLLLESLLDMVDKKNIEDHDDKKKILKLKSAN